MAKRQPILIAGGGIGGLSLSIALARQGLRSHVLERSEHFSEAGAGIQLGPNATRILSSWDVLDRLDRDLVRPEDISIFDGLDGVRLATVPLGAAIRDRYGAPYCVLHRADLQRGLLDAARSRPEIEITTGFELTRYVGTSGAVSAYTDDDRAAHGRALIGADGIASRVRKQLNPDARLRFAGKTAWRTLLPPETVANLGPKARIGLWLAPNAHFVHYPVRGGRAINIVAVIEDPWHQEGWNSEADVSQLLPHFEDWAEPVRRSLDAARDWRKWALFDLPALQRWTAGNVALLGDAAHPVLPFLAQGGALSIEDAATLAQELSRPDAPTEDAFRRYASRRQRRARRVQSGARQAGRIYHMGGAARWARNLVLGRRSSGALLDRFDWLYGFDLAPP